MTLLLDSRMNPNMYYYARFGATKDYSPHIMKLYEGTYKPRYLKTQAGDIEEFGRATANFCRGDRIVKKQNVLKVPRDANINIKLLEKFMLSFHWNYNLFDIDIEKDYPELLI